MGRPVQPAQRLGTVSVQVTRSRRWILFGPWYYFSFKLGFVSNFINCLILPEKEVLGFVEKSK